jgi:hypothetical protein
MGNKRRKFYSGSALCDAGIAYARKLKAYLIAAGLNEGQVEDIDLAVDLIRYSSFVAGSWQQEPITDKLDFPPIGE